MLTVEMYSEKVNCPKRFFAFCLRFNNFSEMVHIHDLVLLINTATIDLSAGNYAVKIDSTE